MPLAIRENVPLAGCTTLGVGGPARYFFEAQNADDVKRALSWADARNVPLYVIGGGSNLLVADRGLQALVVRQRSSVIEAIDETTVDADAGTNWDQLVAWCVAHNLAGVECLSGIPGDVGAAPIQNIGAYGQELAETLVQVEAIDRQSGELVELSHAECQLGYRNSVFKREAEGRYIICRARCRLTAGGAPKIAYAELERATRDAPATLHNVRETIIRLRRAKSMVLDPTDENRRSAGSFFVNPTVPNDDVEAVRARAAEHAPDETMPAYSAGEGRTKLSAAWMIERAGLLKGTRRGQVGISTKHSLAIVNHGSATASDLIAFAIEVKTRVRDAFGITLHPEPRLVGFEAGETTELIG
jgi:UDP-N-acetylmuramate dehydrogenase